MNTLVRKEIRLLLPAWVAAMAVTLTPTLLGGVAPWDGGALLFYGLAAMILGLAIFGQELGAKTLGLFLVQPLPREDLWRIKTRVFAGALMTMLLIPCIQCWLKSEAISFSRTDPLRDAARWMQITFTIGPVLIIALAGSASGLWTTLLFRQIAASIWIALLVPLALILPVGWIMDHSQLSELTQSSILIGILGIYAAAGFWAARRLFMNAQDIQWTGGNLSLSFDRALSLAPISWLPRGPWKSLIQKELQLQQTTLFITLFILVFHLVAITARKNMTRGPGFDLYDCLGMAWSLWMIVPMVVGAAAVAEERNLNTWAGCLCLPVKRRVQFFIKLAVVLTISVIFGGLVPAALEWAGESFGIRSEAYANDPILRIITFSGISVLISLLCFYTSTLARNLLQALGVSVVLVITCIMIQNMQFRWWQNMFGWSLTEYGAHRFFIWPLIAAVCVLTYRNFTRLYVGFPLWRNNVLVILGVIATAFALIFATAVGAWEFFIPVEPDHGTAKLQGSVRPTIVRGDQSTLLALLPDGRLWQATKFRTRSATGARQTTNGPVMEGWHVPTAPIAGTFIGSSNWTDVAYTYAGIVAIRIDGTLWEIEPPIDSNRAFFSTNRITCPLGPVPASFLEQKPIMTVTPPRIRQIGTDSNWKSVISFRERYLAVKTDGTLWNGTFPTPPDRSAPLGDSFSNRITAPPIQVGTNSDWVNVYSAYWESALGLKRDGSICRWGQLGRSTSSTNAWTPDWMRDNASLTTFRTPGTNIVSMVDNGSSVLALDQKGTLWLSGNVPEKIMEYPLRNKQKTHADLLQVGPESEWRQITSEYLPNMLAIKRSGELEIHGWYKLANRTSRYSDWIGIDRDMHWDLAIALAADGTLSAWPRYHEGMQMPSRKPAWNYNILEARVP